MIINESIFFIIFKKYDHKNLRKNIFLKGDK